MLINVVKLSGNMEDHTQIIGGSWPSFVGSNKYDFQI